MLSRLRERLYVPLLLTPALAVVIVLFMGGLVMGLLQSLGYMPVIGSYEFNLSAYFNVFRDRAFLGALGLTIWISFATTILSTILAIVSALVLRQSLWGKKVTSFIFQLNVPVPHIVGAVAIMFLFAEWNALPYHLCPRPDANSGRFSAPGVRPVGYGRHPRISVEDHRLHGGDPAGCNPILGGQL